MMRVNVYTEELPFSVDAEIVTANYTSSRTGEPMTNYGLRVFLRSHEDLHHSIKDDDRSAVTFWCGPRQQCVHDFLSDLVKAVKE